MNVAPNAVPCLCRTDVAEVASRTVVVVAAAVTDVGSLAVNRMKGGSLKWERGKYLRMCGKVILEMISSRISIKSLSHLWTSLGYIQTRICNEQLTFWRLRKLGLEIWRRREDRRRGRERRRRRSHFVITDGRATDRCRRRERRHFRRLRWRHWKRQGAGSRDTHRCRSILSTFHRDLRQ